MKHLTTLLAMIALAIVAFHLIGNLRQEAERLRANNFALNEELVIYRSKLGHSAASVAELRLRFDELREQHKDAIAEIRALNIKLRRVESYARSATKTTYRDTLILREVTTSDTTPPQRTFAYNDAWLRLAGAMWGDTLRIELRSVDTLHQVVHRIPRRFLGIAFGTKYLRQEITSSNPHTELVYSEYIKIERRGKRNKKW